MARYIDADIVLPKIQYRERTYGCSKKIYSKVIKDTPTADVRPERHGEWKYKQDGHGCYCSECDGFHWCEYKFCHWCGAMMDGKDGDTSGD